MEFEFVFLSLDRNVLCNFVANGSTIEMFYECKKKFELTHFFMLGFVISVQKGRENNKKKKSQLDFFLILKTKRTKIFEKIRLLFDIVRSRYRKLSNLSAWPAKKVG